MSASLATAPNLHVASMFQKLDHRDHVLLRPGMYIGSVEAESKPVWVYDASHERMIYRNVEYVPGLYKIVDEIIMNAADHCIRTRTAKAVNVVKKISVAIDVATGVIMVENDGDGIPIQEHPDHPGTWVPELIFGHMLTSANYNDAEGAERMLGGQNGIGAKACNIFSKWFEVDTVDAEAKKRYVQRFEDNMATVHLPKITSCKKKPYTRITFLPDYMRFGMASGLTEDHSALLMRRVVDVTAITAADVSVVLNDKKLSTKSFERYCDLYLGGGNRERPRVYESVEDGKWELVVALSDGTGLQHVSFVNGIATLRGGRHVDHVVSLLSKRLVEAIESRRRIKDASIKPQFIKDNLFIFLKTSIPNPTFDSQSKEILTTPVSKLGIKLDLSDRFIDRLIRLEGLVERVVGLSDVATERGLRKTDGTKRSTISGIPKLEDAEWAGTAKSVHCTLILTEGESAKAMAIAGMTVVGHQKYGVYPLRGKVLNVCDASAQKVSENVEIANLKKILGLQTGRVYTSTKELRYGRIMALCDSDVDGSHIKGLIMNLFLQQWPSLLEVPGFICCMLTPIVKARHVRNGQELSFYSLPAFAAWKAAALSEDNKGSDKWRTKYYKGLGTSTSAEAKQYFRDMMLVEYMWDEKARESLDLAFNKKRAHDRKTWLAGYPMTTTLDYDISKSIGYSEFIHKDLIHFSSYDIIRSIPSVVDGFKVSQRKVLFAAFKRNLREEIRVAQLAGYVSEHAAYHHGEASLQGTIIGMAQDFVGSNNLNILEPVGQFGSRLAGGQDHASARYIHTHLSKWARLIFPDADDGILEYQDDDGMVVEPKVYIPVIPMVLVNGAAGIGTGYSTSVPCYNPLDLVREIRARLLHQEKVQAVHPWYRGYTGSFQVIQGRLSSRAVLQRDGNDGTHKMRITELPIGMWTDDFKAALEALVEKCKDDIRSFSNYSSEATIDFVLTFASATALDAWLGIDEETGLTRLETELKLITHRPLSTSNMHLFGPDERIKKYTDVKDIIDDFVKVRLSAYNKRKEVIIQNLWQQASILSQKVNFLSLVISGQLVLHTLHSDGDDLAAELNKFSIAKMDGSWRYLTSMPLSSLSVDKKKRLEEELVKVQATLKETMEMDASALWLQDLNALEGALVQDPAFVL